MHLAQLTGLSTSYLGHIENLRAIPSRRVMEEISAALNLAQDYLFPESLIEAMREGLFDHRVAELEENQLIRLTEGRRAGLLPPGITQDEALKAVERTMDNDILKQALSESLETLEPREEEVLELRFGLKDGISRTLEEVGSHYINKKTGKPISKERISKIERGALRKLRAPRRSRRLKDFLDY